MTLRKQPARCSLIALVTCLFCWTPAERNQAVGDEVGPPMIIVHPQDITVFENESATFSVVADGEAPLSYQWRKDGADIPGETSDSMTIDHVMLVDSGAYQVAVSNSLGTATSDSAELTVVVDDTPPSIECSPDLIVEGGPSGAIVYFDIIAEDDSGVVFVTSEPPSGSLFPAGTTVVTSVAEDPSGNQSFCSFSVTVVEDVTPPTITAPPDATVYAWEDVFPPHTGTATATDNSGLPPEIAFADSTTELPDATLITRTWTAADESGNTSSAVQLITVITDAVDLIEALADEIADLELPGDLAQSLNAQLSAALASLDRGNEGAARNQLAAFVNHVNAQRGRHLTEEEADFLIAAAATILDSIDS